MGTANVDRKSPRLPAKQSAHRPGPTISHASAHWKAPSPDRYRARRPGLRCQNRIRGPRAHSGRERVQGRGV